MHAFDASEAGNQRVSPSADERTGDQPAGIEPPLDPLCSPLAELDFNTRELQSPGQEEAFTPISGQNNIRRYLLAKISEIRTKAPEVAVAALAVLGVSIATVAVTKALGVTVGVGNAGSESLIKELGNPAKLFLLGGVLAPAVEEFLFRFLPSKAIDEVAGGRFKGKSIWLAGIATSVAFALAHNVTSAAVPGALQIGEGMFFNPHYLPLPQLAVGLLNWHFMRKYGFGSAMFAHSVVNSSVFAMLWAAGAF